MISRADKALKLTKINDIIDQIKAKDKDVYKAHKFKKDTFDSIKELKFDKMEKKMTSNQFSVKIEKEGDDKDEKDSNLTIEIELKEDAKLDKDKTNPIEKVRFNVVEKDDLKDQAKSQFELELKEKEIKITKSEDKIVEGEIQDIKKGFNWVLWLIIGFLIVGVLI